MRSLQLWQALVRVEKWLEALMLALDFYEGHACAVVGLPREMLALRNLLEPHIKATLVAIHSLQLIVVLLYCRSL